MGFCFSVSLGAGVGAMASYFGSSLPVSISSGVIASLVSHIYLKTILPEQIKVLPMEKNEVDGSEVLPMEKNEVDGSEVLPMEKNEVDGSEVLPMENSETLSPDFYSKQLGYSRNVFEKLKEELNRFQSDYTQELEGIQRQINQNSENKSLIAEMKKKMNEVKLKYNNNLVMLKSEVTRLETFVKGSEVWLSDINSFDEKFTEDKIGNLSVGYMQLSSEILLLRSNIDNRQIPE